MMECRDARELLAERALRGVGPPALDTHLLRCAGCRRELDELAQGAEVLALAVAEAPPPELEARVVRAVRRATGARARPRRAAVALVAAALVAAGWGAAVAGGGLDPEPFDSRDAAAAAAGEFGLLVEDVGGGPVREAVLHTTHGGDAGGRALLYEAGEGGSANWVLVFVGGLPEGGSYRARAIGDREPLSIGPLFPSSEGRLAAYRLFGGTAEGLEDLIVTKADGMVVLRGSFDR